jgi:hypothetical protein
MPAYNFVAFLTNRAGRSNYGGLTIYDPFDFAQDRIMIFDLSFLPAVHVAGTLSFIFPRNP